MNEKQILTHTWQEQGLGRAPFRFVEMICILKHDASGGFGSVERVNTHNRLANKRAKALGLSLCQCQHCDAALLNNCVIRDADGKHFVVGTSCVEKSDDAELITEAKLAERRRQKSIRDAKRKAKWEAAQAEREKELDAQRERNGGLTDQQVEYNRHQAELAKERTAITKRQKWLIDVVAHVPGGFCADMTRELQRTKITSLSDRCQHILCDIYAKQVGGRRGSKKYKAAEKEFDSLAY